MKTEKKGKFIAKKAGVFALLIVALSGAVYLNWQYSAKTGSVAISGAAETQEKYLGDAKYVNATAATTKGGDFFANAREKREADKKESLAKLNDVLDNVKSGDEAKQKASEQIAKLTDRSKAETDIETLILAKGFKDCVAVLSDNNISVVVKCSSDGLLDSETRQIQDIVATNSKISLENIKIIEIK